MKRASIALVCLVLFPISVRAQGLPAGWTVAASSADPAWTALEARSGKGWSVLRDPVTGAPSLMAGPGIAIGGPIRADEAGIARARALLEELRDVLGVDDPAAFVLERALAVRNPWGHEIVTIDFKQTWHGLDVRRQEAEGRLDHLAKVKFRFNGTLGRLVLLGSDAVPGLAPEGEPRLGEPEARARAIAALPASAGAIGRVAVSSHVSVRSDRRFLAREVRVATASARHDFRIVFDAATGELVDARDDVAAADVEGTVSGGAHDYTGGTFAVHPLRDLRVSIAGSNSTVTGPDGGFSLPALGNVLIEGGLAGPWARVTDLSESGDLTFRVPARAGTPANVTLNGAPGAEHETAEVSAFHWAMTVRAWLRGAIPSFNGLADLPIEVNKDSETCNAWGGAVGLTFVRSLTDCNNTASLDIVAHEYGHAFHVWFHGSLDPRGFSEGIGDHLALYYTGQRVVGRNFRPNGESIRDYRPGGEAAARQWPCPCEPHMGGQVWAGFAMDLRDALIASMGPAAGAAHAKTITVAQYASDPAHELEALTGVLVLDDDDGSLANGTPNCALIAGAARRHSLPLPHTVSIACSGEPAPPSPEFRAPVVEPALSSGGNNSHPTLDPTGLRVWWVSDRSGGLGGTDVWTASRTSRSAPWGSTHIAAGLNSAYDEHSLAISPDGLMSVVSSNRPPSAGFDLWFAFRESANDPWGPQVRLYNFWGDGDDLEPVLSSDGLELLFVSDRAGSNGMAVWSSEKDWRGAWSFPARLAGVDTAMNERSPVLSGDDRTLMVARPQLLGQDLDWVMYRRGGRGHPFTLFRWVSEINSTQSPDFGGQRPGDGFSMFFTRSSLIGITSILRADRIQPVVDGPRVGPWPKPVTVSFTLRRDPGDFGFLAIGLAWTMPTPVPPVVGDLLIAPLAIVASGPLDANGLLTWSVLPPTGIGGLPVYFQGLAQDGEGRLYLSNRHTFVSP